MKVKIDAILNVVFAWLFTLGLCIGAFAFADGRKAIWIPLAVVYFVLISFLGYKYFEEQKE